MIKYSIKSLIYTLHHTTDKRSVTREKNKIKFSSIFLSIPTDYRDSNFN